MQDYIFVRGCAGGLLTVNVEFIEFQRYNVTQDLYSADHSRTCLSLLCRTSSVHAMRRLNRNRVKTHLIGQYTLKMNKIILNY